jgi:hypothetical protein
MVLHCMAAAGMPDKSKRHRIEVHDTGVSSPRRLSVTLTPGPLPPEVCYRLSASRAQIWCLGTAIIHILNFCDDYLSIYVSNRKAIQLLLGTAVEAQITLRTSPRCTSYIRNHFDEFT